MRPGGLAPLQPVDPAGGIAGHLVDMGDGVQAPGIVGRVPKALQRRLPGGTVGARLLQREGVTAQQIAARGMVGISRQKSLDRAAHPQRIAKQEADRVAKLHRQRVAGMQVQHRLEIVDRVRRPTLQPGLQGQDVAALARGHRAGDIGGAGGGQGGACIRGQLAPAQQQQEDPLGRMAQPEPGIGRQRGAQMRRCRGAVGEKRHLRGVPAGQRVAAGCGDRVTEDILHLYLARVHLVVSQHSAGHLPRQSLPCSVTQS